MQQNLRVNYKHKFVITNFQEPCFEVLLIALLLPMLFQEFYVKAFQALSTIRTVIKIQ